ncbi:ABC transporter ATP-binding protein [Uliginosibacterium sp. H1]|uniref:ABC transporter ATP-binding protein n=1 Tax=Uliginosibacterium sp. H1 TaxID=3114757 RepID=UPI002E16F32B|nr:ABC transporter ATP-binding protein [Uliginosibacterium sp. H1]
MASLNPADLAAPTGAAVPVAPRVLAQGVVKSFGLTHALRGVDLQAAPGEYIALLGPSGCGKTTLLRVIAGFERPDEGSLQLEGRSMSGAQHHLPPEQRGLGMVFQSYALWPHMTVADNVGFALSLRKLPPAEQRRRVDEALAVVGLSDLASRQPAQLSGGQRQRVALARCLAMRPPVVLLDEPLANLDTHLREAMQHEFRRLNRELGATFIHVTHDHAEAMSLADRVVVMEDGLVRQDAAPEQLYREPSCRMVAEFVGGGMVLPVTVWADAGDGLTQAGLWGMACLLRGVADGRATATACFRPRDFSLEPVQLPGGTSVGLRCQVVDSAYRGGVYIATVRPDAEPQALLRVECTQRPVPGPARLTVRDGWLLPAA